MKQIFVLAFMMAALSSVVYAQKESAQQGGMCFSDNHRISNSEAVWRCENLGRVTIKEIYEKGFRVVGSYPTDYAALQPNATAKRTPSSVYQYLVIEEQRR
ncbi:MULTISPECIES: hypothetical protein [Mycetohabitans]|jgi:hypothetical protein|uniref:Uncharacterized protein n=1 Tax=Mycetohabitans rhizoxinica TaxID=412963 RepID=A0ABZ2Q3D3_9BURK|nr:hypothetical protein [Mycetohabitans sp. B2]MCF7697085.1 hypothetical protein [Mycetohabitans sp. B2]